MGAEARKFHDRMFHGKALGACGLRQTFACIAVQHFGDIAAGLANQQGRRRAIVLLGAGHIGIAALDLVDKILALKEVQRPVNRDRCRPRPVGGHAFDDLVGAHGLMTLRHANQHVAALAGEACAAADADLLGMGDDVLRATVVIVLGAGETHDCYIITFQPQRNGFRRWPATCTSHELGVQVAFSLRRAREAHPTENIMLKSLSLATGFALLMAAPALAIDFETSPSGSVEFDMPSGNICCSYFPDAADGPLLSCSRVKPKYWTVTLTPDGDMKVYKNPGEVPGCGYGEPLGNVFDYGTKWKLDGIVCTSSTSGLKCMANGTGFKLSKSGLVKY